MNSKRRLLLVTRSLPFHGAGGMEFVAWDLARALVRAGVGVGVLTTRIPGRPARLDEEGIAIHALPDAEPGRYSRAWWRGSREWFVNHGAALDAVLSVSAGAYGFLGDRRVHPRSRFVMQAHGTSPAEIRSKLRSLASYRRFAAARNVAWLCRDLRAYSRFDRIVAIGPAVADQLRGPLLSRALPSEGVTVIENGVDTRLFRSDPTARFRIRESLGWGSDDLVVATVCRLHAQKGVREALRGVAELSGRWGGTRPALRWLVAGDGEAAESLRAAASRVLPAESVHFVGEVGRDEVPALLNAADVFLFTTRRTEGLPLNVLEAAAAGLPLVLSRDLRKGLGLPEPVVFVEPSDARDVAGAIERLALARADERETRKLPAFPERYTLEWAAARYMDVLFPEPSG